jgi:hypothetical protein
MSQGEALSLFSQLTTALAPLDPPASQAYRAAADATFRSLTLGPQQQPWVSMVDAKGYLWLQEYPQEPPEESDFTYNGFGFAALGLWDYWHLTGSTEAADLFDGAVTTLAAYQPVVRNPGWASDYSLRNPWPHVNYHLIHAEHLLELSWLTGRRALAARSDAFFLDYPGRELRGTVLFAPGTHVLHRFDAGGAVVARRSFRTDRLTAAPTMTRERVRGRGIHYRLAAGPHEGWFATELPRTSWLRGIHHERHYAPQRAAAVRAGQRVTLVAFDAAGRETSRRTWTPGEAATLEIARMAVVNGALCLRVASGPFTGRWVARSAVALT